MCGVEVVSPGHTKCIRQVEAKVYEASTSICQVGFREESADEETLHDGGCGIRHQEEEYNSCIAVWKDITPLAKKHRKRNCLRRNFETFEHQSVSNLMHLV